MHVYDQVHRLELELTRINSQLGMWSTCFTCWYYISLLIDAIMHAHSTQDENKPLKQ